MWYVENNLLPNELIKYTWNVHNFYILLTIGLMIFWFFLTLAWWWIFGILFILFSLYQLVFAKTTEIVVTNKRILYKTGVIGHICFGFLNKDKKQFRCTDLSAEYWISGDFRRRGNKEFYSLIIFYEKNNKHIFW